MMLGLDDIAAIATTSLARLPRSIAVLRMSPHKLSLHFIGHAMVPLPDLGLFLLPGGTKNLRCMMLAIDSR